MSYLFWIPFYYFFTPFFIFFRFSGRNVYKCIQISTKCSAAGLWRQLDGGSQPAGQRAAAHSTSSCVSWLSVDGIVPGPFSGTRPQAGRVPHPQDSGRIHVDGDGEIIDFGVVARELESAASLTDAQMQDVLDNHIFAFLPLYHVQATSIPLTAAPCAPRYP